MKSLFDIISERIGTNLDNFLKVILGSIGAVSSILKAITYIKTYIQSDKILCNDIIQEMEQLEKYKNNRTITTILKSNIRKNLLKQASNLNPYNIFKLKLFIFYLLIIILCTTTPYIYKVLSKDDSSLLYSVLVIFLIVITIYVMLKLISECLWGFYSLKSCLLYYKLLIHKISTRQISIKLRWRSGKKKCNPNKSSLNSNARQIMDQSTFLRHEKDISACTFWCPLILATIKRKENGRKLPDGFDITTECNFTKILINSNCCYILICFLEDLIVLNKLYNYLVEQDIKQRMIKIVKPIDKDYDWFYHDAYSLFLLYNSKMLITETKSDITPYKDLDISKLKVNCTVLF